MQTVEISLLGAVRVRLDNQPIPRFYSAKTQALLAYLAVESASPHLRAKLAGLLWPEFPQANANRSLRQALFQLNRTLDNQRNQFLHLSGRQVQFNMESDFWLDVEEFSSRIAGADFSEAVTLYRGPFLDGFHVVDSPAFEEWMHQTRERLHQSSMSALAQLTAQASAQGDSNAAQNYANQMLAYDPWNEEAHRALMAALAQQGQRSAALTQYARCQRILDEELGIAPESETVQLYERIRNELQDRPKRPPSEDPVIVALPISQPDPLPSIARTPLLGRQSQMTQIISRLTDPRCRLLTLVGLGGMGKTRLAIEAAKELTESPTNRSVFPDGVWFVPLLDAKSSEGGVGVIAQTLGIHLYGGRRLQDQVIDYLRPRTMLLILDNFEHLLDAAGQVAQILAAAPALKIVVTSQEALNLWEEWFFPVGGLPLPDATSPDTLAHSPAVRLFALNARQRNPSFQLEAELESVVQICRLVSGMPLAIELAAAWLTRMSCRQIAQHIEEGLDFLSTSASTIPMRHRSIRAVLDKSWALLSSEEQDALCRLSIFGGGFHRLAAQKVVAAPLSLLNSLTEKTFLQVVSANRYLMPDLISRYAEEMLLQRPQMHSALLAQHSDYFLSEATFHNEGFFVFLPKEGLAAMDQEFENILAAWRWSVSQQRFSRLDRAQRSIFAFCLNRGRYADGVACFALLAQAIAETATDQGYPANVEEILGRALARQGFFEASGGDLERGMDMIQQALVIARSHDKPADIAFCLTFLAEFEGWRDNYSGARQLLDESIAINEEIGDSLGGGFALYRLGELTHTIGDFEQARMIFQRCVAISRQAGVPDALGYALDQLGYCLLLVGELVEAQQVYQESLRLFREVGDELGIALASTGLGVTAWALGNPDRATKWLQESIVRTRRVGHSLHLSMTLGMMGVVFNDLADFAQARPFLEEGLALARRADFGWGIVTCLNGLAQVCWETGRLTEADALLEESLSLAMQFGLPPLRAEALVHRAHLLVAKSSAHSAPLHHSLVDQAVELLTTVLDELPVHFILRQRAEKLLSTLREAGRTH